MPRAVEHDDLLVALDAEHMQRVMRLASVEPQRISRTALGRQIKAVHKQSDK